MDRSELKRLSKNDLIRLVLDLARRVDALEKEKARLRKDSSTSSKPPSSDITKPPSRGKGGVPGRGRRIGGQEGHEKHERQPLPPEEIDDIIEHSVDGCPDCGGGLRNAPAWGRVLQQIELVHRPFHVTEHRTLGYWCSHCRIHVQAELPRDVECGGLFGPRMSAFVAYLKGGCHSSYTTIQSLLDDVLGVRVSTGFLAKVVDRASRALAEPHAELCRALASQPRLNVDESGHKDRGESQWTWCFRAPDFTWFTIHPSRGSDVLRGVLGETFDGVIGSDYFSAYHKYAAESGARTQFCFAHLIRDVRFLTTLQDKVTRSYGERVLGAIRDMFAVLHARDGMQPARFDRTLAKARRALIANARRAPPRSEAQNIAARFRGKAADAYFEFVASPGVEPTNNLAEQAIRFIVIDRKITQGTRGSKGRAWCERIWTTLATLAQRGQSAFGYLERALHADFAGYPAPSLVHT